MSVCSKLSRNTCNLPAHALVSMTRWISWSCFWAMRSVEKRPFSPFMNVLLPSQPSSWRCLVAITCPLARPFLAFLPPSIKGLSRRCARSLRKTCCSERLLSPPPLGVWDRCGQQYVVVDVDGTKQAASPRALPHLPSRASRLIVVLIRSVPPSVQGAQARGSGAHPHHAFASP